MRPATVIIVGVLMLFTTCKKERSDPYSGNFYIRIPLIENANSYLIPANNNYQLNLIYNRSDLKRLWTFIPLGQNHYNIDVADSASFFITDYGGLALAPANPGLANRQVFKIIKDQYSNAVYLQSDYSGQFIRLEYCFKGNETWGYNLGVGDTTNCNAYADINLSGQADTCYCINKYFLERN
jgi:hypothetical protein